MLHKFMTYLLSFERFYQRKHTQRHNDLIITSLSSSRIKLYEQFNNAVTSLATAVRVFQLIIGNVSR
jgi:hypothetical protein